MFFTRCVAEFNGGVDIFDGDMILFCCGDTSSPCNDICFHLLLLLARC
jgi:hypothetical protein